jgi:hypothetical protein
MKTQYQLYRESENKCFRLNQAFLEAVADGLSADELRKLIERRPEQYARFSNWLEKLP